MKKKVLLVSFLLITYFSFANIYETIEVIGRFYTSKFKSKNVVIITEKEINLLKSDSVSEILASFTALNISRKGGSSEIFDISMRGGNFEQVLILINGVAFNNVQTGHFNSDFPFQVQDIKTIEIIKGGSSTTYGSGAYSGVINIILKKNSGIALSLTGGENGYYSTKLNIGKSYENFKIKFGINKKKSNGFYEGREFDILTITAGASYSKDDIELEAYTGYKTNSFGAEGFYAPFASLEDIESIFSQFKIKKKTGDNYYYLKYSFNTHNDYFILDRHNIDYFNNESRTKQHNISLIGEYRINKIRMAGGLGFKLETMDSSSMGYHNRKTGSIFFNINIPFNKSGIDVGLRTTFFDKNDTNLILYSGLYYDFNNNIKLKLSTGKSFRMPSFTELYYNSPSNHGNTNLQNETNLNYETSILYLINNHSFDISLFYRDQNNSIDWVKYSDIGDYSKYWQAVNIEKNNIYGFEFIHNITIDKIIFNYGIEKIYSTESSFNFLSKYGLRYPDFVYKLNISIPIIKKLRAIANYNYKTINNTDIKGHFLDFKLNLKLSYFKITLRVNNVFDTIIEEIPGIKIPGRWAYIQFSYDT